MQAKNVSSEVILTTKDAAPQEIRITGISPDILSDPEQIRKIMESLGLPKGAEARILHTTEDVIVR